MVKFYRFRPPVPIDESPNLTSEDTLRLEVNNNGAIFSFQVKRDRNGVNIWDTSIGGLLYADKFIQIATFLPGDKIYGFGENIHHEIKVWIRNTHTNNTLTTRRVFEKCPLRV